MIYLKKNITNLICLTLNSSEVDKIIFTSEFNLTQEPYEHDIINISDFGRYVLFEFNVPTDLITGQYTYKLMNGVDLIQEGRMVIELENTLSTIYE